LENAERSRCSKLPLALKNVLLKASHSGFKIDPFSRLLAGSFNVYAWDLGKLISCDEQIIKIK
jgi:hypothetical protein